MSPLHMYKANAESANEAETPRDEISATVTRLTVSLQNNRVEPLERFFARRDAAAPSLTWSPRAADLRLPVLKRFAAIASAYANHARHLHRDLVTEATFGPLMEHIMIVDVTETPGVFAYAHYGAAICQIQGEDLQGKTTAHFGELYGQFFAALYRAVLARGEWVLSVHEPPMGVFAQSWNRLIVPITDDRDQITGFVVCNYADSELRAGLEIVPYATLIVNEDHRVCFANTAATELLSEHGRDYHGRTFEAYTNIAFPNCRSPEDMLGAWNVVDKVAITLRETMITEFEITISANLYRGVAYYVVTMRLASDQG